ncbi:CynX/NimT family MFS transporter [soil metagenome]
MVATCHHASVTADTRALSPAPVGRGSRPAPRWLTLVGIVVLALNLRPSITSLGVSLGQVGDSFDFSGSVAGVLTTLPVLCFAVVGLATQTIGNRIGVHRTATLSLVATTFGLLVRGLTDSTAVFFTASVLSMSGIAIANVTLPHLVKLHFPDRIAAVAGLYSALLMTGALLPALTSVPIDQAADSWRAGLLVWAMVAGLSLLPWLALTRHEVTADLSTYGRISVRMLTRSRLAWCLALFCGLQSAMAYAQFGWLTQIYVDAGLTRAEGSLLLGLLTAIGIPLPLLLPWLFARVPDHRVFVTVFSGTGAAGFVGLWLAPATTPWLWAVLMGVGGCAFPYVLTMIGLRAHTPDGVAALSAFTQSVGYLVAAIGPLLAGLLYELTGGWDVPLVILALLGGPMLIAGLGFAREQYVEDTLPVRG